MDSWVALRYYLTLDQRQPPPMTQLLSDIEKGDPDALLDACVVFGRQKELEEILSQVIVHRIDLDTAFDSLKRLVRHAIYS